MHNILSKLAAKFPVITDGAWGTQLQSVGLQPGECPDLWNLTHPERVKDVARSYINAGSKIILTNTFQSNRFSLRTYGLEDKILDINRMGVLISRKAASEKVLVFGSIGPCAKLFMENRLDSKELFKIYSEQAFILAESGVDAIIIETITNLVEAKIALEAVKKTKKPVGVSLVFDNARTVDTTLAGETPEQVAAILTESEADFIGANCGTGIENYISICKRLKSATHLPIWIKPSAGIPRFVGKELLYPTSEKNFAEYALALSKIGAAFIGGCCGTTPEFIRAINHLLKTKKVLSHNQKAPDHLT